MAKVIHSMIRVLDVGRSKEFYEKAFGLKEKRYLDFDDFALVYLGMVKMRPPATDMADQDDLAAWADKLRAALSE